MLLTSKYKYFNRSLRHGTKMRHRNLRSNSVLVHTGYIGTGAILVPGFSTQPYSHLRSRDESPLAARLYDIHDCFDMLFICAKNLCSSQCSDSYIRTAVDYAIHVLLAREVAFA